MKMSLKFKTIRVFNGSFLIKFNSIQYFHDAEKGMENKVRAEWLTAIYTVAPPPTPVV